jgi:hypothetical protein
LNIIDSLYSSSVKLRPARTSNELEVTPPCYISLCHSTPELPAYLVGTRVFEEDNTLLFQEQPRLLGKEQIGTLDDVLEVGLALRVDKVRDVRDVDGLGSSTTGYKEVGLDSEMEVVSEISSIRNDLAG